MLEETDRQIENGRTRVTRHRLVPGSHTGLHPHRYDYVVVPVTSGRMRIVALSFADMLRAVAYFRLAGVEHDVFNDRGQEMVFVEVEFIG